MIPSDTQPLLNAEIARRDSVPAFAASLSKDELVMCNQDLERIIGHLQRLCNRWIVNTELINPGVAGNMRKELTRALNPIKVTAL